MHSIEIMGGNPLEGNVKISGAKNAMLPIMSASLMSREQIILQDISPLLDVNIMLKLLTSLGAKVNYKEEQLRVELRTEKIKDFTAPYDLVSRMRASLLVMGPLLARHGRVRISQPGGCAIGQRPIDLHIKGLVAMGAEIIMGHGYIEAHTKGLKGAKVYLDYPSVGATENLMMAASLAEGITTLENAAEEPEIVDLANFINSMGGKVYGAGTDVIKIEGVKKLRATRHTVIPDRIEAGTFMIAAAITGGNIVLENVIADHLKPVIAKLKEAGAEIDEMQGSNSIHIRTLAPLSGVDIKTLPYPGFPTDLQAQMVALLSITRGTSMVKESVFENRFMHVPELKRMGADISIEGRTAIIRGTEKLLGAQVKSTDLRASAALVLAGLAAQGRATVSGVEHLDRGYYKLDEKLKKLGANIIRHQEFIDTIRAQSPLVN